MTEASYARKAVMLDSMLDQAAQDGAFRKRLLGDARGTLAPALGDALPQAVQLSVVEDERNLRHIVLPYAARPIEEEIADLSQLPDGTPAVRELYTRAFREPEFRERLLRNPAATLQEVLSKFGEQLPKGVMFRAVEETEQVRYVVLPPAIDAEADEELTDADLDLVAGGTTGGRALGGIGRVASGMMGTPGTGPGLGQIGGNIGGNLNLNSNLGGRSIAC